jgi:hypothetical protein
MTLDFPTLIRFLRPAIEALLSMVEVGTPQYFLAQIALTLLGQFSAPGAHAAFRATPAVDLPPEEEWTPDGIAAWAQQQATAEPEDGA